MIAKAGSSELIANPVDFSRFDRKWFAIVISGTARSPVLRGFARYLDDDAGPRLRISVENECHHLGSHPVFEILADEWNGLIEPDGRFGNDCQIHFAC